MALKTIDDNVFNPRKLAAPWFDGVNNGVTVPYSTAFDMGDGSQDFPFTLACWFYPKTIYDPNGYMTYVDHHQNLTNTLKQWWLVQVGTAIYLIIYRPITILSYCAVTATLPTMAVARHLVATYDGRGGAAASAGMRLILDGIDLVTTRLDSGDYTFMGPAECNVEIGWSTSISSAFRYHGLLRDSQIYSGEKNTPEDIERLRRGHTLPGCIARWTGGETLAEWADKSGNGHNASSITGTIERSALHRSGIVIKDGAIQ